MSGSEQVFVIAECGVNHNGSLDLALKLVDEAVRTGADAVKFQTFKPEALVSRAARMASYQRKAVGGEDSQLAMLASLVLPERDHQKVKAYCDERSIDTRQELGRTGDALNKSKKELCRRSAPT